MTWEEYIDLFHEAQVNLVAFKQVLECDMELLKMVNLAIAKEREACAMEADYEAARWPYLPESRIPCEDIAAAIRARGEKQIDNPIDKPEPIKSEPDDRMKPFNEATRLWVDPASGWWYGFPKIWDKTQEPDCRAWLIKNGYPEKDADLPVRMWMVEEK